MVAYKQILQAQSLEAAGIGKDIVVDVVVVVVDNLEKGHKGLNLVFKVA